MLTWIFCSAFVIDSGNIFYPQKVFQCIVHLILPPGKSISLLQFFSEAPDVQQGILNLPWTSHWLDLPDDAESDVESIFQYRAVFTLSPDLCVVCSTYVHKVGNKVAGCML